MNLDTMQSVRNATRELQAKWFENHEAQGSYFKLKTQWSLTEYLLCAEHGGKEMDRNGHLHFRCSKDLWNDS